MGPGRDRTRDPWICSQLRICNQTRYRLRYAARYAWIRTTLTIYTNTLHLAGLSWDALLKHTSIHRKGHAWRYKHGSQKHAKANNPHTADDNPEKENNFIMYSDSNNLYGRVILWFQMAYQE